MCDDNWGHFVDIENIEKKQTHKNDTFILRRKMIYENDDHNDDHNEDDSSDDENIYNVWNINIYVKIFVIATILWHFHKYK